MICWGSQAHPNLRAELTSVYWQRQARLHLAGLLFSENHNITWAYR